MRIVFWGIALLILFGCATGPTLRPPEVFSYKTETKIGIVNLLPKTIKHYHIGTTIFNNFEKDYTVPWDLPGDINAELHKQCIAHGYNTVILDPSSPIFNSKIALTTVEGDMSVVSPTVAPMLLDLAKQQGITLLFIVQPADGTVFVPNFDVRVKGYGVATRNFLAIGSAKGFSMLDVIAISLNPLAVTQGTQLRTIQNISGLKMIGNFSEMSDDDLSVLKETLRAPIKGFVTDLLMKSNLVQKESAASK